jgi:cellulose synthase/poly-beta-1,6-N-acetylglucosamine synthase-like glycosyltransferase
MSVTPKNSETGIRKKNLMYLTLLAMWGFSLAWFNPRLLSLLLLPGAESIPAKISLILFILCLDVFWLFGSYHIVMFLFSLLSKNRAPPHSVATVVEPKVAILYVTRNDFKYEAAYSCVDQEYGNYHVFILDDSTDRDYMAEVDRFHSLFGDKTSVIRRETRKGFKAGSLNNALRNSITDFPYFAVTDSDGIMPLDFLKKLMPYFRLDSTIAFVQAANKPNPAQTSKFATDLSLGILPLWNSYYPPRNDYGLVIFLGHGGIVRRDVWEVIGGFPEIVSEDLAFSIKIRELGYQGYFVSEVQCFEDFPETYRQLRKQQEKYVKGGCQYILSYLGSFLKSSCPRWFEKLDLLLWCSSLLLPAFYIFFLFLFCLLLPLFFGEARVLTLSVLGSEVHLWTTYPLSEGFHSIWTWDFYAVTILMMFAPVLGCLRIAVSQPWKTLRLLSLSCVAYLSLMVVSAVGVLTFFLTRKAEWAVTGDRSGAPVADGYAEGSEAGVSWLDGLNSTHGLVFGIELLLGLLFTYGCLRTLNLGLLAFSLPLLLGPFVYKYGWDNKALAFLAPFPFLVLVIAMGTLGLNLWGLQGAFLFFFPVHF